MTHVQVVRIKKLAGTNIVNVAARHNLREIVTERGADSHIDTTRTGLNRVLLGDHTAAGVAVMAQALLDNAGVKVLRKDAVRALEIIFCLPLDSSIDHDLFFRDALAWTDEYFHAPIISAVIHYDEAAPHCHVLVLPLVRGRMIGSDLMGNCAKLQALQFDFHAKIGQRHGLARHVAPKRLSASVRRLAVDAVFDMLEANSGLNPDVLTALLAPHLQNPEPLLLALGLEMPKPIVKGTFAGIMTKPTKPERTQKPIGFDDTKPIGFGDVPAPEKEQTLSCVGFGKSTPSIITTENRQTDEKAGDLVREREADNAAGQWNGERGEFIKPPPPAQPSAKLFIVKAFAARLEANRKVRGA
jgi:hypothetical protein